MWCHEIFSLLFKTFAVFLKRYPHPNSPRVCYMTVELWTDIKRGSIPFLKLYNLPIKYSYSALP